MITLSVVLGAVMVTGSAVASGASASPARLVIRGVAGTGQACRNPPSCGDFGFARNARLTAPAGVALDRGGNLYIADHGNNEIRKVLAGFAPLIIRLAGTGSPCLAPPACGDGGPAINATLSSPTDVAVNPRSGFVIADTQDNEVRAVLPSGIIIRIAGDGLRCTGPPNCGDGGPSAAALLSLPQGVAVDRVGNLYIADSGNNEIRKVSPKGIISRLAGTGGFCLAPPACGDGGRATNAQLSIPSGVTVDGRGNIYIADTGDNEIRKVSPNGIIHRVAGDGLPCFSPPRCGDGGPALSGALSFPSAVTWNSNGALYVADQFNQEIRKISPGARPARCHGRCPPAPCHGRCPPAFTAAAGLRIFRVAGTGHRCQRTPACGNGGPALAASLNEPQGVAVDGGENVWLGDSGNNQVRAVGPR